MPRGSQVVGVLGVGAAAVALVSVPLAVLGVWNAPVVALIGAAAAVGCVPFVRRLDGGPWTPARIVTWVALAAVALLNLRNTSEAVTTDRDPGIYYLKSHLLVQTGGTVASGTPDALRAQTTYGVTGLGLYPMDQSTDLYTQFLTGSAALQALGTAVLPATGAMVVSVLLTWLASVALFELAAPVAGDIAAGGAAVAAALSLTWVYFGRGTYSEPAAAALLVCGLLLMAGAVRLGSTALGLLGGLVAAGVFVCRVDAGLALGPALLALCLVAARTPGRRRAALAAIAGTTVGVVAQVADGLLSTPGYFSDLRVEVAVVAAVLLGCIGTGVLLLVVGRAVGHSPRGQRGWERVETTAAVAPVVAAAALTFLWVVAPTLLPGSGETGVVGPVTLWQAREGIPQTMTDYSESLGRRLAWSTGAPLLLLAVAGLAVGARRVVSRPELAPLLLAGIVTATGYVTVSSITPDLPWALRRLFPAVIPAAALAAALGIRMLLPRRTVVQVGAAVLLVGGAIGASLPVLFERERAGTLTAMGEVCDALPEDAAVYVLEGQLGQWARPIEVLCDVEVALGSITTTGDDVLRIAEQVAEDDGRLVVLSERGDLFADTDGVQGRLLTRYVDRRIEQTVGRPPEYIEPSSRDVWLYEATAPGAT